MEDRYFSLRIVLAILLSLSGCTKKRAESGSIENPIKLFFVPSVDIKVIEDSSKKIKAFLERETGYNFEVSIPQSYIAVVEAFGTDRADVAALNSFGYFKAHSKYGAEARLMVLRHGSSTYQSQFLARTESKIKSLEDLQGKKVAFVDPSSASGYLLPLKMLRDRGIVPGEVVFAMKHDNVVSMVYNDQVDAGATFHTPTFNSKIEDARRLVITQYPDVEQKVRIIALSEAIPNDPIVFRASLSESIKQAIVKALLRYIKTTEGREAFKIIYGVDDLREASDGDYQSVLELGKISAQVMEK